MPRTAKRALKPYVEGWLKELDACYQTIDGDSVTGRKVERKVLTQPAPAEHTGRLHWLVAADYSPLVSRAEALRIEDSGETVALARSEFPTDFYWTVIKKWDRSWRKLRVVATIKQYVADLRDFWEREWSLRGGDNSPFTREWIHYGNLLDAHRLVYRCEPGKKQMDEWERRFPAVVVIQRIERGKAGQAADIKVLERWASPWCKEHVVALYGRLHKYIRKLDSRAENSKAPISELLSGTAELYAAALAQDIQARHQQAMQVVRRWEKRYGNEVSAYLRMLGNVDYIHQMREVMPLRGVGDPVLEQRERIKAAKQASARHNGPVESLSSYDEDEAPQVHYKERRASRSPNPRAPTRKGAMTEIICPECCGSGLQGRESCPRCQGWGRCKPHNDR